MRLAQDHMRDRDLTTFVASDHGFAPQFLAIDASKVLVDLGLLSTPQTGNCRLAAGETIGKAKVCYAGGAAQIYLNLAGRDPARAAGSHAGRGRPTRRRRSQQIRAAFPALKDTNDWTGDGQPENWKVIDRTYTKAEARYIPNGRGLDGRHGAPDPHGRPRRLLVPAVPVRRGHAGHADRASRRSSASTATCRTCRTCKSNTNMRATFLAGGDAIERGEVDDVRSRSTSRRRPRSCSTSRRRSTPGRRPP